MNELISIIVPIYNVEKYIKRCIESIINQTYSNIEIILVDDGSPDNCGKICDEYVLKDKRIKVIHKKNGGLSSARNAGLEIALGKYISFIDSDDYISSYFIEKLYKTCKDKNCEITLCEYERVYSEIKKENTIEKKDSIIEVYDTKQMLNKLYSTDYLITTVAWNKLYKRDILKNIRYPDGRLHEDEATTYKILYNAKKVAIIREKLYYYYYDENSIMNKKFNIKRLHALYAFKERADFFKQKGEIELYELSNARYTLSLMNYYVICKTELENSEFVQFKLFNEFKKNVDSVIKYKNIKTKTKLKLVIAKLFPKFYELILNKKIRKEEK